MRIRKSGSVHLEEGLRPWIEQPDVLTAEPRNPIMHALHELGQPLPVGSTCSDAMSGHVRRDFKRSRRLKHSFHRSLYPNSHVERSRPHSTIVEPIAHSWTGTRRVFSWVLRGIAQQVHDEFANQDAADQLDDAVATHSSGVEASRSEASPLRATAPTVSIFRDPASAGSANTPGRESIPCKHLWIRFLEDLHRIQSGHCPTRMTPIRSLAYTLHGCSKPPHDRVTVLCNLRVCNSIAVPGQTECSSHKRSVFLSRCGPRLDSWNLGHGTAREAGHWKSQNGLFPSARKDPSD